MVSLAFTDRIEIGMKVVLDFVDITERLPGVGHKVLCKTSNGKYFISEMYFPHDGRGRIFEGRPPQWKGSTKTIDTITHWAYLPD